MSYYKGTNGHTLWGTGKAWDLGRAIHRLHGVVFVLTTQEGNSLRCQLEGWGIWGLLNKASNE